ncbi:hypothetical protein D3C84_1188570 [compost metagenome]
MKEDLDAVRSQFDLKYWPSLDQLFRALAADAESANLEATDLGRDGSSASIAGRLLQGTVRRH